MRRFIALLAAGLFAAGAFAADDAITLKAKQPGPGDVVKETKSEKSTNKFSFTIMGKDQVQEVQATTKFVYTDEVIEKPAGAKQPTKLKRTYETASITQGTATQDPGLAGKTVLIEKKGDKYSMTIDGKELTGLAALILGREFGKERQLTEEDLLSNEPVKVGGTWKVDIAKVAKDLSANGHMSIDVDKSSATGKLVKVYDKDGHKFGVMEINMELVVTKGGEPGQEIEMKAGSTMKITGAIDACIDGTLSNGTSKVQVKGDLSGTAANKNAVKMEMSTVEEGSSEEVKKK